uniref:Uncharacterized protein n=1 Tax=Salarias fasciatus TaxID=181472 RepID=A0A672GKE0_SALFA
QTGSGGGTGSLYGGPGSDYFFYGFPQSSGGSSGSGSGSGGAGSGSGGDGAGGAGNGFPLFGSFPLDSNFVVVPQFFDPDQVRLPQFFFGNAFDFTGVPVGAVAVRPSPPASHITQTSNGYQRARSVLAHTKFSPNDFVVVPLPDQDGSQVKDQYPKNQKPKY